METAAESRARAGTETLQTEHRGALKSAGKQAASLAPVRLSPCPGF
jgi:hypothetical protein